VQLLKKFLELAPTPTASTVSIRQMAAECAILLGTY
jgi:hypothetical protein